MQGLISFIIPVRDRDMKRIKNCVRSLKSDITGEIIIIDYGSKKPIKDIKGTILIRYDKNKIWNKSHAINLGIKKAKYEYIGTVDCDMIISPEFISSLKKHIYNNSFIYSINVKRIEPRYVYGDFDAMLYYATPWNNTEGRYSIIHNANGGIQVYPKKWIKEIGGLDESLIYWGGMDNDVFERAIISGLVTININAPLLHQEHKFKKEKHLSGKERIMAIRIRVEKAKYLADIFKDRQYVRNNGRWGMDKPNQRRFLKSWEEHDKIIEQEKKKIKKYNKVFIGAVRDGKTSFIFNGKEVKMFNE